MSKKTREFRGLCRIGATRWGVERRGGYWHAAAQNFVPLKSQHF
jgi:hypothetical protein